MKVNFDTEQWQSEIEQEREDTRDYFITQFNWRGAPQPDGFDGPTWYPADEKWRVEARLDREAPGTGMRVQLPTSIGDLRDFDVYGTFVFEVGGVEQRLTAYRMVPEHPD